MIIVIKNFVTSHLHGDAKVVALEISLGTTNCGWLFGEVDEVYI